KYAVSDFAAMSVDVTSENMPHSFEGSVAITTTRTGEARVGIPENPTEARCREVYERRTGQTLAARGTSSNEYELTEEACDLVNVFVAGARSAGADLTQAA